MANKDMALWAVKDDANQQYIIKVEYLGIRAQAEVSYSEMQHFCEHKQIQGLAAMLLRELSDEWRQGFTATG